MAWLTISDPFSHATATTSSKFAVRLGPRWSLGLALLADCQRMFDRVQDVLIRDPVPRGGSVDVHVRISYRETPAGQLVHSVAPTGRSQPSICTPSVVDLLALPFRLREPL